jgi:hypothetical protein
MSSWKTRLREADTAHARDLAPEEARRLRRTIVAEAERAARPRIWSLPFVLTAGSLAAAAAALVFSTAVAMPPQALEVSDHLASDQADTAPQAGSGRQQLQFATPGGTRIIWVFDAEFDVKGTLP